MGGRVRQRQTEWEKENIYNRETEKERKAGREGRRETGRHT